MSDDLLALSRVHTLAVRVYAFLHNKNIIMIIDTTIAYDEIAGYSNFEVYNAYRLTYT